MDNVVLLTGLSCVGKSLGGEIIAHDLNFTHAEASAVMRDFWQQSTSSLPLEAFAGRSLLEDPSRVPLKIIERAKASGVTSLVVSGLRSRLEADIFASAAREVRLIFIDADPGIRLQRCIARGRAGHPREADELLELDTIQNKMGVRELAKASWASRLINNRSIEEYRTALLSLLC